MPKQRKTAPLTPGDTFAVPLDGGRYSACRVVRAHDDEKYLVVSSEFIGKQAPQADDPSLKTTLRLTHGNWTGNACCAWVQGPPPHFFQLLGNLPLCRGDKKLKSEGIGDWAYFRIHPLLQWQADHPDEAPPPEPNPDGQFILHRFNGDEVYRLKSAVMFAGEFVDKVMLWLEVEADAKGAKRCKDTKSLGVCPQAETGIKLKALDASRLVRRQFLISGDDDHECQSSIYYCEHEPLRNNRITILSRKGDRFRVRWTGETIDVNYYDGSKPPTQVEIEGDFRFKDYEHWVKKPAKKR